MALSGTGRNTLRRLVASALVVGATLTGGSVMAQTATPIELTLERMVELGLRDSYRVRQLQMGVDRTRANLNAERAGLKSRVELELNAPTFESISDYRWNSDLQREELVYENTRRWEAELSVRQPVVLFGFPTDGYLSLNNRVYRYNQIQDDESDVRYYNRYFVAYNQPLFQPNRMKNNLEEAELGLERSELDYRADIISMVDDLADDYFRLFSTAYERDVALRLVQSLDSVMVAAQSIAASDPARAIEVDQLQVALANAREQVQQAISSFRLQAANIKQRLRLSPSDSLMLRPVLTVEPVEIDVDRAIGYATELAPRMRRIDMDIRQNEIRLDETKGSDAFRMNLGLTYGREMQDARLRNVWEDPRNSYTVNVEATIPIWDWGQHDYRVQAQQISLDRALLTREEAITSIRTSVENEVRSLSEYEQRALSMQTNLDLSRQITATSLQRYRTGKGQLVDVLQTISRESDTAENFLEAYLGYRQSLLRLQELTYYDFMRDQPVMKSYPIDLD